MDPPVATTSEGAAAEIDAPPAGLSPRVKTLWRVEALVAAAVVSVLALVVALATDAPGLVLVAVGLIAAALVGAAWYLPGVAHRSWRYDVTPDGLELRRGVLVRRESSIPHFRVQHIDVRQGPIERLLGVATLAISTASSATDAHLPGIEPERAEVIRRAILERVEADDGV